MPLTIAHPAMIVPIFKRMKTYSVFSALVIGSMSPDFTYFLFLPIERGQTHNILGIFWFCLPLGLLTYFIFHKLMKQPLFSLFPEQIAIRFARDLIIGKENKFFVICLSIIIGAMTHLFWDSFTHEHDVIVLLFPFLQIKLFDLFGYEVFIFKVLQHGSSVVGTVLLGYWTFRWYQESKPEYVEMKNVILPFKFRVTLFYSIFLIATLFGLLIGYYSSHNETGMYALREFLLSFILNAVSIAAMLFLAYSFSYQFMKVFKNNWEGL